MTKSCSDQGLPSNCALIVFGGVALGLAALASASNLTGAKHHFSRFITTQCRDARDAGEGCKK